MRNGKGDTSVLVVARGDTTRASSGIPLPTTQFRRRAWLAFQRALDPLAPPRPLPMRRSQRVV